MGIALFSSTGRPLGLVAALGTKAIPEDRQEEITALLQIFGARAAAELERKNAEQALKRSAENYRAIFDAANDAIFIHDINTGEVLEVNPKTAEMYGYPVDEVVGIDLEAMSAGTPGYGRKEAMQWIRRAAEGPPQVFEWLAKNKKGELFWVEINLKRADVGGQQRILAIVRDITGRKAAEERLKQLSQLHQLILEAAGEGIFGLDRLGNFIFMNKAAAAMLGFTPEECIGRHSSSCMPYVRWADGTCYPEKECKTYAPFEEGKARHVEDECFCRRDGTRFPVEYTSTPIVAEGRILGSVVTFSDITARRRTEEALRTSETNYREIFESVNDAIFVHDIDTGDVISSNRKTSEMFGYPQEEFRNFLSESLFSGALGYTAQDALKWIRRAAEGPPQLFEWLSRRKNGQLFWVEVNLKRAVIGGETRLLAIVREITERKKIEQEVKKITAQLEEAQQIAGIGSWESDMRTNKLTWSDEVYRIFNIPRNEFKGTFEAFLELVHPEDRAGIEQSFKEAENERKETAANEYRIIRPDGAVRIIHTRLRFEYDGDGRMIAMRGTAQDVTEARQAEEELKLTQFSVDHASISVFLVDRTARILYVNEQACRVLGYAREELLAMKIFDLDPNAGASSWNARWVELKEGNRLHLETLHTKKDGNVIPVEITSDYIAFGGREYNWAFAQDISERKKAEEELIRINRQNELILESAGDGIIGMNAEGNHIFLNSAAANILGYSSEKLMGKHSHSIWHHTKTDGSPFPESECLIYQTRWDGNSRHVDGEVFWKKDGTSFPVEYVTTPIREGDAIVGTVVSFKDISERKRAEAALLESEERFRTLADNIAQLAWMTDEKGEVFWYNKRWRKCKGGGGKRSITPIT
jgi:PAS domain S-box-containing protein